MTFMCQITVFPPHDPNATNLDTRKKPNQKNPGSSTGRIYANIVLYPAQIGQINVKMPTNVSSSINQNQVVN